MKSDMSGTARLFFCFGPPKSGTTLLQRMLNLHPEVSCPSEHIFHQVHKGMKDLFKNYNQLLRLIDRRTGGQGATLIMPEIVDLIFCEAVRAIIHQAANGKAIMGANDNTMLHHLDFYDEWFEQPRMIAIFRNPIDQGLSGLHHNLRLAREENDPRHEQLVTQHGGPEGFLRKNMRLFVRDVDTWRTFSAGRKNVYMVRYEDLVADRKAAAREIFSFLNADIRDEILDPIVAATDIDQMRVASSNPEFFRRGASDMGREELRSDLRRELAGLAGEALEWLGYRID